MQDNLILERQYADSLAQHLTPAAADRWDACRSAHRFAAYEGKQLVIFNLFYDEPQTLDVLTCKSMNLDIHNGLSSTWRTGEGTSIQIGHAPVEVAKSVFLWHVFYSEVSYLPYKGKFEVKLPLAYRSQHNIHKHRTDVVPYILERAVFDSLFTGV